MDGKLIIGVDIGGTKSAVVLATEKGEIRQRRSEPTQPDLRGPLEVLERLAAMARELLTAENVPSGAVQGVGVSCGGPLDTKTGVVYAPPNLPGWEGVPVKQFFEKALALPVRIENDANATALAEWRFGAGKGTRNFVFLTMGTGIGGGVIIDGRLAHGANDLAGEIGHQTILMNGPLCGCGKRGCLEALASGPAIARLARESALYGRHRRVLTLAGGRPADITAHHIVEAAKEGDPFAIQILEEAGTYMGVGIANVMQMLNPECIALGTIAVHAGDLIMKPIEAAVEEFAWKRIRDACRIVPAALGDRGQDLAAVALWITDSD
jgi:glucokinase